MLQKDGLKSTPKRNRIIIKKKRTERKKGNIYNEKKTNTSIQTHTYTKHTRVFFFLVHRNQRYYIIMTSETDYHQFELKDQKRPIRPKLLKLTDDGRSRKKSKFKVIDRNNNERTNEMTHAPRAHTDIGTT